MGLFDDYQCGTCWKSFVAWQARDDHVYSTGHQWPDFECDTCSRNFGSESARFQHMDDMNHFQFVCGDCGSTWPTEEQLTEHQYEDHYYCAECDREFISYHNLMQVSSYQPHQRIPKRML